MQENSAGRRYDKGQPTYAMIMLEKKLDELGSVFKLDAEGWHWYHEVGKEMDAWRASNPEPPKEIQRILGKPDYAVIAEASQHGVDLECWIGSVQKKAGVDFQFEYYREMHTSLRRHNKHCPSCKKLPVYRYGGNESS